MIVYPNAKINIGLNIIDRRNDGFHNISTLFYPIKGFCDILEIIIAENQNQSIVFNQTGVVIDCATENNLCIKAYNLINNIYPLPPMAMHLHKIIPIGAGLGGGSADGAFALKVINELAGSPLNMDQLLELALELGSDCPFFITNSPSIGSGRGEKLIPVDVNLNGYTILLINPGIHVNTGKAYSLSNPKPWDIDLEKLLKHKIEEWKDYIINDFEKVVFDQHSEIEKIKLDLYRMGATYAAMSGSGSTVFGLFINKPEINLNFENYYTKLIEL